MFRLHDTTRRRVCGAAFVVFGILPTLLAGGWCVSRYAPGYVQTESRLLARSLGLNVTLGDVRYLRPGRVLYEQVEANDPETNQPVFRCRLLEIAVERPKDCSKPILTADISQLEIKVESLDRIWRCLTRALEGYAGPLEADVRMFASDVTLHDESGSQTLTDVDGSLETLEDKAVAQVHFRLAGSRTPEPARICIVRNRQIVPPASRIELYTGDGSLPCDVLALGLRDLESLASDSRFEGVIWANESPSGWQGEITGTLSNLDLDQLISERFPYKLGGRCTIKIGTARFRDSRLEEGSAVVTAGPGTIDRTLIQMAAQRLGLLLHTDQLPSQPYIPYDQLAFNVTLDSQGLRLRGFCDAAESGTILTSNARSLLSESTDGLKPVAALVQILSPQNTLQVPASRQADLLMRHLPIPQAISTTNASTTPHVSVRVRETRSQ